MSWHKPYRTTLIRQAVLVSLIGTTGIHAHAVSLGQANITSAQHEPLSATIDVSDIDAKNFNASLAGADIYQQMGLTPDSKIKVKFTPTSATSGKITLSSSTPIATPFADVVLNLNNNGEQLIEPQTLLMPLPSGSTFTLPEKQPQMTASETWDNLPTVSPSANEPAPAKVAPKPAKKEVAQVAPAKANVQQQVISEEITRRAYPQGQAPASTPAPSENLNATAKPAKAQETKAKQEKPKAQSTQTAGSYVVQSGDSLWSIANEIAKANNLKVGEVMKAIHEANPSAFNNGKMNNLKAKASLDLPAYEVVLSQKAIEDAIASKRKHNDAERAVQTQAKAKPKKSAPATKKTTASPRRDSQITARPAKKALPKPQVTLVTPSQQGQATGTNTKASTNAVAGGSQNLVGTLKNTRTKTATSAKNINNLNQELSSATQKLQLQNQKLAELEARLRALKSQK